MLSLPRWWRAVTHDTSADPAWLSTYRLADVLSPGRSAAALTPRCTTFCETLMAPNAKWVGAAGLTYLPVTFPGFSWANLKPGAKRNAIPGAGGAFFRQQFADIKALGLHTAFIAMFDEVDEGTAIFKLQAHVAAPQASSPFMALDADGFDLPSDYYLRVAQEGGEVIEVKGLLFWRKEPKNFLVYALP